MVGVCQTDLAAGDQGGPRQHLLFLEHVNKNRRAHMRHVLQQQGWSEHAAHAQSTHARMDSNAADTKHPKNERNDQRPH